MKKSIKITLVILSLMLLILPITYSYAIDKTNEKEKSFFEISELEVSKNEKIEMTINLDKIKYNKFVFELKTSENIENLEISNKEPLTNNEALEIEKSDNEIAIEINKETTNLSTITLYYQIPETMQVNDKIKFVAVVTNMEIDENEETELENQTIEAEVKIVEKKENTKQPENGQNSGTTNKDESKAQENENMQGSIEKLLEQSSNNNSSIKNAQQISNNNSSTKIATNATIANTISGESKTTEQTVTYNGSDNNYLSELSIRGYTLNKEFSKDNSTYFITIENDVSSLDITANADDDSSTVCIYGNEDLKEGTNKILISVTAENGNVRNYRIYVTKNS